MIVFCADCDSFGAWLTEPQIRDLHTGHRIAVFADDLSADVGRAFVFWRNQIAAAAS